MLEGLSTPLASTAPPGGDGSMSPHGSDDSFIVASSIAASEAAAEHHSEEASRAADATGTPPQAPLTWRSSGLLLLVSLGTLAVVGQLVSKDAAVAELASEVSVLRATMNRLLEDQVQTKQTNTMEAVAEMMAIKREVQEVPTKTKEWVNEELGKLKEERQSCQEASRSEMMAIKKEVQEMPTKTKEWVNEELGKLKEERQSCQEASRSEMMAIKEEVQEMPTKDWVNEQLSKCTEELQTWNLQFQEASHAPMEWKSIVFYIMVTMVSLAVIWWINALKGELNVCQTKLKRVDGMINALKEESNVSETKWKLVQAHGHNRHDFVVFVWLSRPGNSVDGDIDYVLYDGSLLGPPTKKAFKCTSAAFRTSVVDEKGLEAQVMERLASSGLPKSTPWTYVANWRLRNLDSVMMRNGADDRFDWYDNMTTLQGFQEYLSSGTVTKSHSCQR